MATAEQTGVMALARLWWNASFTGTNANLALEEIGRQSLYLTAAWDADEEEVMVGVGDQLNTSTNPPSLIMFSDFGRADFALSVRHPRALPAITFPIYSRTPLYRSSSAV